MSEPDVTGAACVAERLPDDELRRALRVAMDAVEAGQQRVAREQRDLADDYARLMESLVAAAPPRLSEAVAADLAGRVDETDRVILRGLAAGMSRRGLVRHCALTRFEVDSRMTALHRRAGTTTLFQLGVAALAFGWLEPPDPPASH